MSLSRHSGRKSPENPHQYRFADRSGAYAFECTDVVTGIESPDEINARIEAFIKPDPKSIPSVPHDPGGELSSLEGAVNRSPGTVSYTHLRAHETPEHLVC